MASWLKRSTFVQRFSWPTFFAGLGITAAIIAFFVLHPTALVKLDLISQDLRMYAMPHQAPSGKVVVVAIDDKSIAEIGHWPWSRSVLAELQRALTSYGVNVVGYDLIFSERDPGDTTRSSIAARLRTLRIPEDRIKAMLGENNDEQFAAALRAGVPSFLAYGFDRHLLKPGPAPIDPGYLTTPIEPFPMTYSLVQTSPGGIGRVLHADAYLPPIPVLNRAVKGTAFVDIDADADGTMRTELTAIRFKGRYCVPFFLALLRSYDGNPMLTVGLDSEGVARVRLGATEIPVDELGRMLITYRGGAATFPHYSASDVMHHRVPTDDLAGKIVLVGATGKGLGDRAVTPVGGEFPRVEIHANAIDDVLTNDFIVRSRTVTVAVERIAAALLGVGITIATAWLTPLWGFVAAVLLASAYFTYAQRLLLTDHVLVGVVFPGTVVFGTFGFLSAFRYFVEGREKRRLRHAFEHYLHPEVISSVVENPGRLKLGGERRVLTILFADIVNYTGLSERTDPAALVAMLNDYMTKMTDLIMESGGVVDKIRGDGIMAFWGAPAELPNHARAAVDSALAMLTELQTLNQNDPRFKSVDIGVGIATGEAIVGNFGGQRRFDYSVIGDTVNLASRLEGLTRQFKVHLIVSRETFTQAGPQYLSREIGMVRVKGKENAVPVVEVVSQANDGVDPSLYQQFAAMREKLESGNVAAAREDLDRMHAAHPEDGVVGLYLEKLAAQSGFQGGELVFEFDTK
jgi:adenylate cyclase